MAKALKRISLDEFSSNLVRIFERVISKGESVVIERGEGELVTLSPFPSSAPKTEEDWEAFRSAAGSWSDVDTDALKKDIYESRNRVLP
jgi:hypothetical protein